MGNMSWTLLRSPNRAQKKLAPRQPKRSHHFAIVCASVDFPVPASPFSHRIQNLGGIVNRGESSSILMNALLGTIQWYTADRTSMRVVPRHSSRPAFVSNRASAAYRIRISSTPH